MEVRIFNEKTDIDTIDSFLISRKESHGHNYFNTKEWFEWKFLNSPNALAIMPTVFEDNKILGANYYGDYPLQMENQIISAVMPYEVFVHKKCQGKGLFKEMIKLAESTAINNGTQIMLSFPNKKSINGFKSTGWTFLPNAISYWLKPVKLFNVLRNILDIKKGFVANQAKGPNSFNFTAQNHTVYNNKIHGKWSNEYLNWRFNKLPQAEYVQLKIDSFELIGRIGFRGKLKECQILYVNFFNDEFNKKEFNSLIKQLAKRTQVDLLSFPISHHFPMFDQMKSLGFLKLPSGTQFMYKILDDSLKKEKLNFSLCGLDFHTY